MSSEASSSKADLFDELLMEELEEPVIIEEQIVAPEAIIEQPVINYQSVNILNDEVRQRFFQEKIMEPDDVFSEIISTTNTMGGLFSNIIFHESELIEILEPNENVVGLVCNYGSKWYAGYEQPVIVKTNNRGRKKKVKIRRYRKRQGTGNEFNSQLTFVVQSKTIIDPNTKRYKLYKFKIFRPGEMQLPGIKQGHVNDVVVSVRHIEDLLRNVESIKIDKTKEILCEYIRPVMKNYKFRTIIPKKSFLDLSLLKDILEDSPIVDDVVKIFFIKYARSDTKLSIKFLTPIHKKPGKTTRFNIFMKGKINILGAIEYGYTKSICEYLHNIISDKLDELIVHERYVKDVFMDNIMPLDSETEKIILSRFTKYYYISEKNFPEISEADITNMIRLLNISNSPEEDSEEDY